MDHPAFHKGGGSIRCYESIPPTYELDDAAHCALLAASAPLHAECKDMVAEKLPQKTMKPIAPFGVGLSAPAVLARSAATPMADTVRRLIELTADFSAAAAADDAVAALAALMDAPRPGSVRAYSRQRSVCAAAAAASWPARSMLMSAPASPCPAQVLTALTAALNAGNVFGERLLAVPGVAGAPLPTAADGARIFNDLPILLAELPTKLGGKSTAQGGSGGGSILWLDVAAAAVAASGAEIGDKVTVTALAALTRRERIIERLFPGAKVRFACVACAAAYKPESARARAAFFLMLPCWAADALGSPRLQSSFRHALGTSTRASRERWKSLRRI
jgi:hypothetical protein